MVAIVTLGVPMGEDKKSDPQFMDYPNGLPQKIVWKVKHNEIVAPAHCFLPPVSCCRHVWRVGGLGPTCLLPVSGIERNEWIACKECFRSKRERYGKKKYVACFTQLFFGFQNDFQG